MWKSAKTVISYQLSVISYQLSVISYQCQENGNFLLNNAH